MSWPLRGGGGREGLTNKKKTFLEKNTPKNVATKLEGGGGKVLVVGPLKK